MADQLIPLAEAISALRAELQRAQAAGEGEALKFEVGSVEIEFQGVVSREATGGGKASFKIFGVGAELTGGGKLGDQRTQKVKVVLNPKGRDGEDYLVSDTQAGAGSGKAKSRPGG